MLKSNTEPSSPLTAANLRASATRSPSVASPSVMLMTIGGNPFGCSRHHVSVMLVASLSAAHIGVPPFEYGSNQTGNLTVWSITPRAPSGAHVDQDRLHAGRRHHGLPPEDVARRRRLRLLRRGVDLLYGRHQPRHVQDARLQVRGRAHLYQQAALRAQARPRHPAAALRPRVPAR